MSAPPPELRLLRPSSAADRLGDSAACPIDLRLLLEVLGPLKRPLIGFRPPLASLSSVGAGILRAARERRACAALFLDVTETPPRALDAVVQGVAAACDDAGYGWPLALLFEGPTIASARDVEPARERLAALIEAGLTTPILHAEGSSDALSGWLETAASPARERELGWVLRCEVSPWLPSLAASGGAPTALGLSPRRALEEGAPEGLVGWVAVDGREPPSVREALVHGGVGLIEARLDLPAEARGERAEALAYFAADLALAAWDVEETGPRASAALLAGWKE
ncbi:MAG: hypothetical protein ACYCWW_13025 [Deltaproteobacteria bacterium]